jgi:hypothetical protein
MRYVVSIYWIWRIPLTPMMALERQQGGKWFTARGRVPPFTYNVSLHQYLFQFAMTTIEG